MRRAALTLAVAIVLTVVALLAAPAMATSTSSAVARPGGPAATAQPSRPGEGWLTGRRQRLLAVWILIDVGGALLWFGSEPVRAPKLLGSVGAHRPAPPPDDRREPPVRGIGRFARPRNGPPSRLL